MSKLELKQQAKGLLLKGCYRMAFNKYCRLIEMGSEGFSKRDWAIIHLNQGICLQFQQQYDKAVQSIDRSLQIDPTYEKAYYRKMQILREMGQYQVAIYSIPIWLKNKEIEGLLKEIKEEYLSSMGMDQILEDLLTHKTHTNEFIKESHSKFYQRIIEALDSQCSNENLRKIGNKIASYYKHLKEKNFSQILQSFLSKIHFLLIKQHESKNKKSVQTLLSEFWEEYALRAQSFASKQFTLKNLKEKQEFKIIKYAPLTKNLLIFFKALIQHEHFQDQYIFAFALQLSNNLSLSDQQTEFSGGISKIIEQFTQKMEKSLDRKHLGWIKRSFMLVDSLIKFHLLLEPKTTFERLDSTNMFYLHYFYVNNTSQSFSLDNTPFKNIKMESIVEYLNDNLQSFIVIYTFEHFIHRLDRNLIKELTPHIEQELQVIRQLKEISEKKAETDKFLQIDLQKEYQLIYTSMLLKIDMKNNSSRININSILSKSHGRDKVFDESLSDLQINTLLLLAINSKANLIEMLQHEDSITEVVSHFVNNSFLQQIENIKIVTSFVYLLVIDLQLEQEENYAKKMGTSVEDIRKAKKIQGEKEDEIINKKLAELQAKFKYHISKYWQQIIPNYCDLLIKIKDESSIIKWGKFLNQIGKIDHSRFHNSKIISILLQCFKIQKKEVGQLFSILCKKINVDLIKYEYLQSITNVLVHNVQKNDDQLVIFESLLGLINFTSNSNNKVRISIKTIINSVFEENKYIVHAACSLLNNLMVYQQTQEMNKQVRLKEIVEKYLNFYRSEVENDEEVPLTDYSHPSRVYSTLLSLAMVLDLENVYQFQDWTHLERCLLKIQTSKSDILYKCIWYMSMKGKVLGKWWTKFESDLLQLKTVDNQRWIKLQQYIKR